MRQTSLNRVILILALRIRHLFHPFFLTDRAKHANIDESTATLLISVIGIGNTIGRIVTGLASSLPGINALMVNNVFISAGGLVTIFSGISLSEGYQFFYAVCFGLSICEQEIILFNLLSLDYIILICLASLPFLVK